jgi:hypothetical protein
MLGSAFISAINGLIRSPFAIIGLQAYQRASFKDEATIRNHFYPLHTQIPRSTAEAISCDCPVLKLPP